ncbi:MAG TPA: protein translocase subunit SecF [Anaeromyxobacteraceae bacterium]
MQFKTFDIIPHDTKFDFVGKRHIAVTLSLLANAAVILWAVFHGLNFGVDFAGGTEMEVKFQQTVDASAIRKGVEDLGFTDASVQTYGPESEHTYLIRVGRIALMSQEDVNRVVQAVQAKFPVQGQPHFNADAGDKIDFQFQGTPPTPDQLRAAVEAAGVRVRDVREEAGLTAGTKSFAVITQGIQDKIERELSSRFGAAKPEVRRVEYVGPAVGRELRNQGFKAVLYAMALIVVYVGLRFDFRFSPGVIIAIVHDAIITLGYFAFTGREFNLTSVAVILTVVGYSVNDTVVVYDRIRENAGRFKGKKLGDLVNVSINEVLGRTFLTSFATALSLVGLLIYGVGTIFDFSAAMMIGIISGTYSTWFIAAPMTIWLEERAEKKKAKPADRAEPPARAAR